MCQHVVFVMQRGLCSRVGMDNTNLTSGASAAIESEHPLDEAARLFVGGRAALARELGVTVGALGNWKTRGTPYIYCVRIEALVPSVTRQRLRPNDFAEMWPELGHDAAFCAAGD